MTDRRLRVFVLGAGFSRHAGFPLGLELWKEVLPRIDADLGNNNHVRHDLKVFRNYKRNCTGHDVAEAEVDFEEFISFLDIEHYFGLRGSDTLSREGNEAQVTLKHYIGKVLCERLNSLQDIPSAYIHFAESLRPGDTILTFNYDSLLERSLESAKQPYRLFPDPFLYIGPTHNTIDSSKEEIRVLKLHGSADWFSRASYAERVRVAKCTKKKTGMSYNPRDPIFGPDRIVRPVRLVSGRRSTTDPLKDIYRVPDPTSLYTGNNQEAVPFILSPSYSKILYASPLLDFWHGLAQDSPWHAGMAIIGFSLPSHDEYMRQVLYSMTRNYTNTLWKTELAYGKHKLPLRIVDFCQDDKGQQDFREKYRFLNWSRTETFFKGFDEEAVKFLFSE